MVQPRPKHAATPDLLPWQAALMVLCVTAAGVFHEHPQSVRGTLQPSEMRSELHRAAHPADLLNATLWSRR